MTSSSHLRDLEADAAYYRKRIREKLQAEVDGRVQDKVAWLQSLRLLRARLAEIEAELEAE